MVYCLGITTGTNFITNYLIVSCWCLTTWATQIALSYFRLQNNWQISSQSCTFDKYTRPHNIIYHQIIYTILTCVIIKNILNWDSYDVII